MNASTPTESLIQSTLDGHSAAREQLARAMLPLVLGWCHRLGGPRVDPEDAAHDVLVVVFTRLHRLRERSLWRPWLFGITRRVLSRHRSTAWVSRWVPDFAREIPDDSAGPVRRAALSERAGQVQSLLESLPARQREVLVLCDAEERTAPEVSRMLGVPEGTVRSRLRTGRMKFRALAARRGVDVDLRDDVLGGALAGASP